MPMSELRQIFKSAKTHDGGWRFISRLGKCVACGYEGACYVTIDGDNDVCCVKCWREANGGS